VHILFLIIVGIGLGIGAAVPIGPVNVEIARRTLARGRLAGISLGFGAVTVDMIFAALTSLGVQQLFKGNAHFEHWFGYVGVSVCFILAAVSLYAAWNAYTYGVKDPKQRPNNVKSLFTDYFTGFGMTALNLYTWIWWFVTVPALAARHGSETRFDLPITCGGVFIATTAWVMSFTWIINRLRQFAGRSWHIGADLVGGLLLFAFGVWALARVITQ